MKCPNCGTENLSYIRFCTKCGYDFFSPAIEDIGAESIIETDPLPQKKTAPLPKIRERQGYPFNRVIMITITTFLVAGGIGLIGGVIGFIRNKKDRLKGAMLGSIINGGIVAILLALVLILGPIVRGINFPTIDLSNLHFPHIALPAVNMPEINLSNLVPNPSSAPAVQKTPLPSPIPEVSSKPTSSCLHWDTVMVEQAGTSVCVNGTAATIYAVTGNQGNTITRINFSTLPNTFFLLSRDDFISNSSNRSQQVLKKGDCVQALGIVKVFIAGTHQTPYLQVKVLYPCNP